MQTLTERISFNENRFLKGITGLSSCMLRRSGQSFRAGHRNSSKSQHVERNATRLFVREVAQMARNFILCQKVLFIAMRLLLRGNENSNSWSYCKEQNRLNRIV